MKEDDKAVVVSFMNMKGGVGKTTLCVNLAGTLAKTHGKKVLVIDMDPQTNATQYLLKPQDYNGLIREKKTIYALYERIVNDNSLSIVDNLEEIEDEEDEKKLIIFDRVNDVMGLDLVAGDLSMVNIGKNSSTTLVWQLKYFIEDIEKEYDYIFIDCPPTATIYTESALLASRYYILPVKPDYLSSLGINLFQRFVKKHKLPNRKTVPCLGIIFTLVGNAQLYIDTMEKIKNENKFTVFNSRMQHSVSVAKAAQNHKLLTDGTKKQKQLMENLAKEFFEKLGAEKR